MKNSYNPYTVPENFFETTRKDAISRYRKRKNALRYGIAAAVVAAAIVVPAFIQSASKNAQDSEVVADNLAKMYEYDIFLQVNF